MRPCEVFASQDSFIGPASWAGALQLAPPFTDETNPASSRQVDEPHAAFG